MPDDKKDAGVSGDDINANDKRTALLQQIQTELSNLTPDDLARLYAAIALMVLKQGK